MWNFLSNHPVWGLTYLMMICFTVFLTVSMVKMNNKDD